jgi:hypothetical protein
MHIFCLWAIVRCSPIVRKSLRGHRSQRASCARRGNLGPLSCIVMQLLDSGTASLARALPSLRKAELSGLLCAQGGNILRRL